ncbi:MAG TPA: hypothetical protein PLU53_08190 [Bacteroidia bacterium]|nr:hypothetical protein [Bacteroidia bacterium]
METRKIASRLRIVATSVLANMSVPVANMLCSLLVIRFISPELWGSFTAVFLWVILALQFAGFGSKEYLLREFTKKPQQIFNYWFSSIRSRSILLLAGIAVLFLLPVDHALKLTLAAWLSARFLYSSFDAVLLFQKKFSITLILEVSGFLLMYFFISHHPEPAGLRWLLNTFLLVDSLKAIALVIYFSGDIYKVKSILSGRNIFGGAFLFFLLSLSGMIGSRVDLYLVSFYLDKLQLAHYSVLLNFLVYLQALSNFIFQPFINYFYRTNFQSTGKISFQLLSLGVLLAVCGVPAIAWICKHFYHIEFDNLFIWTGMIYVIPVYYYLPRIYFLYKTGKEYLVLLVNSAGIGMNILLNILWLPSKGIFGALLAASLVQLMYVAVYLLIEKKMQNDFPEMS